LVQNYQQDAMELLGGYYKSEGRLEEQRKPEKPD